MMNEHTMGDSLIYVGGVIDADLITFVDSRPSGTLRKTKNGGTENSKRYTVEIFTDDTSGTIESVLSENVDSIKRLIEQFRSPELPGIPFSVDGQVTEIVGQETGKAGTRRAGNVSKPAA
jgi:hypothetical protein